MFFPVARDVFRWQTADPEFGELMIGHILIVGTSYVLFDPPAISVPDFLKYFKVFGKCEGVFVLSKHHKRGAQMISGALGTLLYIPKITAEAEDQSDGTVLYDSSSNLPLNLRAFEMKTTVPVFSTHALKEMAIVDEQNRAFIADIAHSEDGRHLLYGPEGFGPNPDKAAVESSRNALLNAVPKETSALFCGHGEDILDFKAAVQTKS